MTRRDNQPLARGHAAWADLPTPEQAKKWEEVAPGTFNRIMTEIERRQRHLRRMDMADFVVWIFARLCGLTGVIVLAILAKYFVDKGAPTQGATIVTAGAVSIAAIFVTGRLAQPRKDTTGEPDLSAEP